MNPSSGKRTFDGVELLQFAVNETQRFYTDLSAKIGAAIETGQIPAASGGFLQQLTMPQYIAFAPQHMAQVSQPMVIPSQPVAAQQMVSGLVPVAQPGKKVKRKLSAFNVYMQKKCEQLKQAGVGQTDRFQMAAVSWKNLTQEQRQGYIQMFHANEEDPALDILPEPLPGVNNESRAERKRREKLAAAQKKETENSVTDFMAQLQQEKQAEVTEDVEEEDVVEAEVEGEGDGEDRTESEDGKDPKKRKLNKKPRKS